MKKAISLILLLLVSVIFVSCDMKNTKDEKTIAKKETINEKVKKVKSVNEFIKSSNPQLSSSASFLRLNVLSSLN